MKLYFWLPAFLLATACATMSPKKGEHLLHPLVMMTDFGVRDGAVSEMKGVAYEVDRRLLIADLSHQVEPYNIWEGAYRLHQTAPYWPSDAVFVSVVDPGVGSTRKSIVARSKTGQLFVNPDNGLLTLIAESPGLESVREIDETRNRLKGSSESYTFHGRDLYSYTAARLASGVIAFEDVGPVLTKPIVTLPYQKPVMDGSVLKGQIPVLDVNYGNVWTNIPKALFMKQFSNSRQVQVTLLRGSKRVYSATLPFANTFSDVKAGTGLIYINSLLNVSFALNQGNFSERHHIQAGPEWHVELAPVAK